MEISSIPGLGRPVGEGIGYPLQYSWASFVALTVWITTKYEKFFKRWEYQTTLSASWVICMQVKKQQLEVDMEQQTGSK